MGKLSMLVGAVVLALLVCTVRADEPVKKEGRIFEMRIYYAAPGKMKELHARFRNHTCKLFEKHGMTLIGFWSPIDGKLAEEKMIYILAFPSKEAAKKSWKDFTNDPDWKRVKAETEKNGKLVDRVESIYLTATDYSPVK